MIVKLKQMVELAVGKLVKIKKEDEIMKLLSNFLILFLSIIVFAMPVFAANWKEIAPKRYIDVNSYQYLQDPLYPNRYAFWVKHLNDGSKYFKNIEKQEGKKVWYVLTRLGVDCNNKSLTVLDSIYYDLSRQVILSQNYSIYSGWNSIVPESFGDFYYHIICQPKRHY